MQARLGLSLEAEAAGPASLRLQGRSAEAARDEAENQRAEAYKKYESSVIVHQPGDSWAWGTRWIGNLNPSAHSTRSDSRSAAEDYNRIAARTEEAEAAVQREASSKTTALINAGTLGFATAGALDIASSYAPGSTRQAMETKQAAERRNYTDETQRLIAENPSHSTQIQYSRSGGLAEMDAKQNSERIELARKFEQELTQISAQGDAARLRGRGDSFAAERRLFEGRADAMRKAAEGKSPDEIARTEAAISDERRGMIESQNRQIDNAFGTAGTSLANSFIGLGAASSRIAGDVHGAEMTRFDERRNSLNEQARQAATTLPLSSIDPKTHDDFWGRLAKRWWPCCR